MPHLPLTEKAVEAIQQSADNGEFPSLVWVALEAEEFKVYVPDGLDEMDSYQDLIRGRCMTDGKKLGTETIALVTSLGIVGMWRNAISFSAMHNLSFLRTVEERILEELGSHGAEDN